MQRVAAAIAPLVIAACVVCLPCVMAEDDASGGARSSLVHIRVMDGTVPARAQVEVRRLSDVALPRIGLEPVTGAPVVKSQSDARGLCELKGLLAGRYQIRAALEGHAPIYATIRVPSADARVELRMSRPSGDHKLRGRVVWDDGKPFEGVVELTTSVWFSTADAWCDGASYAKTAKDGSFQFEGLAAGECFVNVSQPGRFRHPHGWALRIPMDGPCLLVADDELRRRTLRVVQASDDAPVARANTTSLQWGWPFAKGETDSTGLVTVYGAYGEATVSISKPGLEAARVNLGESAAELKVALGRGGTVEGAVQGDDGTPVKGVQVAAVREDPDAGDGQILTATTNDEGRYHIKGLAEGPWLFVAVGAGQMSVDQRLWTEAGRAASVLEVPKGKTLKHAMVVRPAGTLEVRVTDADGKPVRDCAVRVEPKQAGTYYGFWSQAPLGELLSGRTDAKGVARFDTLVPGLAYWIEAQVLHTSQRVASTPLSASKTSVASVTVPAVKSLEVRAVDAESGAPVAGALVTVYESRSGLDTRWSTDREGRAHIQIRTDEDLLVECEKLGYFDPEPVELLEGKPAVVRLKASSSIKGRVLAPVGMGARLVHVKTDLGLPAGQGSPGRSSACNVPAGQTFELLGLQRGSYKVVAEISWRGRKYRAEALAETGAVNVRLTLSPHKEDPGLRVRVLDPSGKPVPHASASLYAQGPSLNLAPETGKVTEGLYRAKIPEGTTRLWLEFHSARDEAGRSLDLGPFFVGPIAPSEVPAQVSLAPGLRLAGRVVDGQGKGVPGVRLSAHLMREGHERVGYGYAGPAHAEATTSESGGYVFEGLGKWRYQIEVQKAEGFSAADPLQGVKPGARVPDLSIRRAIRVKLQVVDSGSKPVRGARVVLWWNTRQGFPRGHRSAMQAHLTDAGGAISFDDLHPKRTYRMQISAPDRRPGLRGITIERWTPKDQTFRFEPALEISGTVKDQTGRPLEGIRVGRLTGPRPWFVARTDAEGRYRFTDLRAGEYEIALHDNLGRTAQPLPKRTVAAGANSVDFKIDTRRVLRLRLIPTEVSSQPVSLILAVRGPGSSPRPVSVDRQGISYVLDLDPAQEYTLFSGPTREGRCFYRTGVKPGGDVLEVKRSKGVVAQGRLELPEGTHFVGLVGRATMGPFAAPVKVSAGGAWILAGVPAGTTWQVQITGIGGGRHYSARGKVTAGAKDAPRLVMKERRPGK